MRQDVTSSIILGRARKFLQGRAERAHNHIIGKGLQIQTGGVKILCMGKKTIRTSVVLTPIAQEIKDRLCGEWGQYKVLSAALLLFDQQEPGKQKELIRYISQLQKGKP